MDLRLIFGIVVIAFFVLLYIGLISSSFTELKSEKQQFVHLKINFVLALLSFLMYFFLAMFVWYFPVMKMKTLNGFILFSPLLFVGTIDLIILLSHLIRVFRRKIYWNKSGEKLILKSFNNDVEIDLNSKDLKLIFFDPPFKHTGLYGGGFPGFSFQILQISDGRNLVQLSNMEYDTYGLFETLKKQHVVSVKKRQFNFMF